MTTALAERDDVTVEGEVIEQRAPMTLFGTDDPNAVVERASAVATALASVINERHLYASIGGKKHVQVEGWTLLGSMTGVFAEVVWSKPTEDGWEARAVGRTLAGQVVGAAEAMCTRRESKWRNADDYAIRSMSQTRAVSKALRMPLGFIMHLAGYDATPAEEIPSEQPERSEREAPRGRRAPATTRPAVPKNKGEALGLIAEAMKEHRLSFTQVEAKAKDLGIDRGTAGVDDLMRLYAAITTPAESALPAGIGADEGSGSSAPDFPSDTTAPGDVAGGPVDSVQPHSSPGEAAPSPSIEDVLAVTGGELIPPKPGTPEYKALPNGTERAKAKAWHEAHREPEPEQESLAEALGAPTSD